MQAIDWWERSAEEADAAQDMVQTLMRYQKAEGITVAYTEWLNKYVWRCMPPVAAMQDCRSPLVRL